MRDKPGAFGLVGANGGVMSKYSVGVYSTEPADWAPDRGKALQADIAALPTVAVTRDANGTGVVETYSVRYDWPETTGVIIGRLDADGSRFMALSTDERLVALMTDGDPLGAKIAVTSEGDVNRASAGLKRPAVRRFQHESVLVVGVDARDHVVADGAGAVLPDHLLARGYRHRARGFTLALGPLERVRRVVGSAVGLADHRTTGTGDPLGEADRTSAADDGLLRTEVDDAADLVRRVERRQRRSRVVGIHRGEGVQVREAVGRLGALRRRGAGRERENRDGEPTHPHQNTQLPDGCSTNPWPSLMHAVSRSRPTTHVVV